MNRCAFLAIVLYAWVLADEAEAAAEAAYFAARPGLRERLEREEEERARLDARSRWNTAHLHAGIVEVTE